MAYCATIVPAANKWLDPDDWASVISALSTHPGIDEVYLRDFGVGMDYKSFAALHGSMGYNTGVVTNDPITNGLSLRYYDY